MNFGSAVIAPEVYLKALSMARNVARQKVKISNITTLVCDLLDLPPIIVKSRLKKIRLIIIGLEDHAC